MLCVQEGRETRNNIRLFCWITQKPPHLFSPNLPRADKDGQVWGGKELFFVEVTRDLRM